MARDWSREEVEATVSDYLSMLQDELAGIPYSKTDHRRALSRLLNNRSRGAIEMKHMNISAVLLDFGIPQIIKGYLPYYNYQQLLFDVVKERVRTAPGLMDSITAEFLAPARDPWIENILDAEIPVPSFSTMKRSGFAEMVRQRQHEYRVVDFLSREAENRSLGMAGEEFVIGYERARLMAAGADRLAEKVEQVSLTCGDGAGFDVLSFEENGCERLIEVKTTKYGSATPFYVSSNELAVSKRQQDKYRVYRVFDFKLRPRFFQRRGCIDDAFALKPAQYEARINF